jgi:two-component system LytT family response regulator
VLASKNLKEIHEMLDPDIFFRCHNSIVVNLKFVTKYNIKEGGFIEMINGTMVPLSRRRKDDFLSTMAKFNM